jgi:PAS domain S-box-containing protein
MDALSLDTFRFALDNTVDAVTITDINSVIEYVNPAFTSITGYTAEEVIGRKPSIQKSRHTTQETYREMWATIEKGGWWRGEIFNVTKTGEEWCSMLSISQVRDGQGKPFAYVGIARDITEMKTLQARLKAAGLEAIFMLAVAAEAKDEVTGSHIQRVQHYSEALALRLGLSREYAEEIGYSSMMHDVGKIHIPDTILKKAGALSEDEWESMRKHPQHGVAILREDPFYTTAREIAGNHHERWDGTGYPAARKGETIPIASRIVTVADVFDALTSPRPYKQEWPEQKAIEELLRQKGKAFDPDVVEAFVSLYDDGTVRSIREQFPPSL